MRRLCLRFVLISLLLLSASRLGLALWQGERVEAGGGLNAILRGGLRIDLSLVAMLVAIPALLSAWFGHRPRATRLTAVVLLIAWMLLVLLEVATPTFIQEYDSRPNRLFVSYLVSPEEVGTMLVRGFLGSVVAAAIVLVLAALAGRRLLPPGPPDPRWPIWRRLLLTVMLVPLLLLAGRGTLQHRPINPSMVAVGNDAMVNTLALNSLYNVATAVWREQSEKSSRAAYGSMPEAEMQAEIRSTLGLPAGDYDAKAPTLRWQAASQRSTRPRHLVLIIEESLGAQFVGHLGGRGLTPNLDRYSGQGWTFRRAYATGTRSVRGLEALTTGFLPTPSEAVLKLPRSQYGFLTLASLLAPHGYGSRFIYGGEAHFDNMRAFFLGNGFDEVVDLPRFAAPDYVGTWGASDDDMFRELDRRLLTDQEADRPMLTVAFTVSNHTPWEFPPGRIALNGPATGDDAVRYADQALGDFLDHARQQPYWSNTVFLVVADHDARAGGASLVPVHNFHIPALILGAGIAPRLDDRLISQIDLPPTLLSLAGVDLAHPIPGVDLTTASPGRGVMQYGDNHGYLVDTAAGERLIVHEPGMAAEQFSVIQGPAGQPVRLVAEPVDAALVRRALAHALWPEWAYRGQHYRVPPDSAALMRGHDSPPGARPN